MTRRYAPPQPSNAPKIVRSMPRVRGGVGPSVGAAASYSCARVARLMADRVSGGGGEVAAAPLTGHGGRKINEPAVKAFEVSHEAPAYKSVGRDGE